MSFPTPPPPPPPPPQRPPVQQSWSAPTGQQWPPTTQPVPRPAVRSAPSPLRWVGPLLILAGVVVAVLGMVIAGARTEDAVKQLARAPAGCETTLEFDSAGTYRLYAETKGELGSLDGDCPAPSPYDFDGEPSVEVRLVAGDGSEVPVIPSDDKEYAAGGFEGEEIGHVDVPAEGSYTMTVESADEGFAIAVGKDPEGDSSGIRTLLVGLGIVLAIAGAALTVLGFTRKRPPQGPPTAPAWTTPAAPPSAWSQPAQWPPSPPPAPPNGPPPGPPSVPPTGPWG